MSEESDSRLGGGSTALGAEVERAASLETAHPSTHSNSVTEIGESRPAARKDVILTRSRKRSERRQRPQTASTASKSQQANAARHHPNAEILPITMAQRGMWVGQKISRVGTVFNVAEAIEVMGPVDPDIFRDAVLQVAQEAETARTNIFEDAHGPYQVVHEKYQGDVPFKDFTSEGEPDAAAMRWMKKSAEYNLDIEKDPLWMIALVKTAPDRFYWYQRAHHIVYDGFAGGIVAARLTEIYDTRLKGEEPPPSPMLPLRTIVEEEQNYRTSKRFEKDRQFWKERLSGLPEPTSFAQGRWPTSSGLARETGFLTVEQVRRLRDLATEYSCSVPQMLNALAAAFLYRTTGAEDLVYGTPVSARNKKLRRVPGMCANAIMIRQTMSPDLDLPALAKQAQSTIQQALRRQQYRIEDTRRDQGMTGQHEHLVRMAVNIEPFNYSHTFGGHETRAHNISNSSIEDLVIFIYDRGGDQELRIDFDANPSLYTADELRNHMLRFLKLIRTLLDEPATKIGDIDLLSDEDRQKTLVEWCSTPKADFNKFAIQAIEDNAEKTPDAPALRFDGRTTTYAELNAQANRLAWRLIERGVGAGDIIAFAIPRCEHWLVTVLAIHKAGAAFLPMDVASPLARLNEIIRDSGARLVITAQQSVDARDVNGVDVIDVEPITSQGRTDNPSDKDRRSPRSPSDPAYVIYTSGSTGRPKGVLVSQANLTNFYGAWQEICPTLPDDRMSTLAPMIFDSNIAEIFPALCAGAALIIVPTAIVRDPVKLSELLRRERVTIMLGTPVLWESLLSSKTATLHNTKALIGGDILTSKLARTLHDLGAEVHNQYGPTENTVVATSIKLDQDDLSSPPIGRPLAGTSVYVLDANLNPQPIGIAGELYLGGDSVAMGYLNRPELTAERFIQNPFGKPGERLYKTGDLAKWRHDGELEFLGRCDRQLKIRGYRIEPGEVEARLCELDAISKAVVVAHEDPMGRKRLVAYVVPAVNARFDDAKIRRDLSGIVPEYMIPSIIMGIGEVPLTVTNKVDRNRLPEPVVASRQDYVAPRTETEQKLADIFAKMLGLPRVGVEDNFFELGADSITAVQLLAEIESQFSTQLSLLSLFDAPTIANMAQQMDNQEERDPFDPLFAFRKNGDGTPLFCIHSVVGVSWSYAALLRHLSDVYPVYGLQARGLNKNEPLPSTIEEMAEDYLAQIRTIQPEGPYRLLGWSLGGLIAYAMTEKLEAAGEKVEVLTVLDSFPAIQSVNGEAHDEKTLVENALNFINFDADVLNGEMTMDKLAEFALKQFDVFSIPIIQKARMDNAALRDSYIKVFQNNTILARSYEPGKIKADMTVFRAVEDKHDGLNGVIDHQPGAWKKYTSGEVTEHSVVCSHYSMMNPEHLETIGPIVRKQLS